MDELKINQEVSKLLLHFDKSLKPEEKIAILHSTIVCIEQVRLQQAILESMARMFMPIDRKTIN